ncbi:DUF895 domain membrane protein [Perkinsus olseni]|uniref:DUF895 domain membrane protein n=1 Tax=Perkinsus olseni TaxID=32597 RepID=A0A7J6LE96_PEROL|nr:DUF895 domain membrane protein [Perkinsus olseni]KAF4657539.1 DUF895 domain membrane protein [Perkinsus olseni]
MCCNPSVIYSGFCQVILTGVITFCSVGFFNALQGLGGAGNADPSANNAANASLYLTFAITGYLGGAFFNLLGPRVLMSVGCMTFAFYALAAYLAGQDDALQWLFILSGVVLGVGAGWLWTAQGALMLAYAPQDRKGLYISVFWIIFNLGGVIGGLLAFALNFDSSEDEPTSANAASYFSFVGIMLFGAIVAFLGLVSPEKVVREDGLPVTVQPCLSPAKEFLGALSVSVDKNMLLLSLLFFSSNYFYTYIFNAFNGVLFTVRTRGLNSAIFWLSQIVGAWLLGLVLDASRLKVRSRSRNGFWCTTIATTLSFLLGGYVQYFHRGGYRRDDDDNRDLIDVTNGDYWLPCLTIIGYGIMATCVQVYSYWLLGILGSGDATLAARYSGFYKGMQSLGATLGWVLDLEAFGISYRAQFLVCWILISVALVPTFFVSGAAPASWLKLDDTTGVGLRRRSGSVCDTPTTASDDRPQSQSSVS